MYISMGPYQPKLEEFPPSFDGQQFRRFQYTWYAQFPWLEYSKEINLFRSWKRINNGEGCSFLHHEGGLNSHHTKALLKWGGLKNPSQYIDRDLNNYRFLWTRPCSITIHNLFRVGIYFCWLRQPSDRFVRERFFEVVNVKETSASTLKKEICIVLTHYNLLVEDLRGQRFDGASNMRCTWNGLQALFREDCPYTYYVHFFAHRLQLALVKVSKDHHYELKSIREAEIIDLIASGELKLVHELIKFIHYNNMEQLVGALILLRSYLEKMICNGSNNDIRGEAKGVYDAMSTFKFVFILHLMNKVLGISDLLCQALQMKSQDILNAIHLISNGWYTFIKSVISFFESHHIDASRMNDHHMKGTMHFYQQKDYVTVEHYYRIDLFNAVIYFQLIELNNRFTDQTMELLTLSSALNPVNSFKSFNVDDICNLVERFYPCDFTQFEILALRRQLECF
ncbi:TTF-type domain-containing protein [Citrus sinensis]|uniref:TTF-type domain-containing protein n=1 Tax=Citrus sinensis TaxID=2711 RepID=A0ACB8JHV0_CITSI|nr:TTF-type domain-containing protein [Citrus sinensis]